jgi:uncharacterized membrane protein
MSLTPLGTIHTVIGLVALGAGVVALVRYGAISMKSRSGMLYVVLTLLTALTALGIFQHGGFGKPHVLALLTLAALAVGAIAGGTALFGRLGPYVQTFSYSVTFLFHLIPGFTESLTRLPPSAPIAASADDPMFQVIYPILAVLFLIGVAIQFRRLHAAAPAAA